MTTQGQKAGTEHVFNSATDTCLYCGGDLQSVGNCPARKAVPKAMTKDVKTHAQRKEEYDNSICEECGKIRSSQTHKRHLIFGTSTKPSTKRILSVTVKRRVDESPDIHYRRPSESTFATIIERMESLYRGDWCYIGIRAEATIQVGNVSELGTGIVIQVKPSHPAAFGESSLTLRNRTSNQLKMSNWQNFAVNWPPLDSRNALSARQCAREGL